MLSANHRTTESLDKMLAQKGTPLDVVLELQVPEGRVIPQACWSWTGRRLHQVIRQRLVAYRKQTEPLLDYIVSAIY